MVFLITVALVVVGAILLVVGLSSASTVALLGAAAVSFAAVVLLWRSVGKTRDNTFVTDSPATGTPDWEQPLRGSEETQDDEPARDQLPPVAIEQYQDLVASEIMPTLETLSVEELKAVIERERQGLGRPIIISRAETLIDLTRGASVEGKTPVDLREEPSLGRRPRKDRGLSLE